MRPAPSPARRWALAAALAASPALSMAAAPLPALGAATDGTTVSGLSSGAFMSVQMHVAHSSRIAGAAILAGGPYHCAEGSPALALNRCMATTAGQPDGRALAEFARQTAAAGRIDPVEHIAGSRLYIFGGSVDPVVTPPVVSSLIDFYRALGVPAANMQTVTAMKAGHTFATGSFGNPCDHTTPPFIGSCGVDQAGDLLQQLYGKLEAPAAQPSGRLVRFDQGEFLADARRHGMDDTAFMWLPKACEADASACRVHVAFHGCLQGREHLGEVYATLTGYNRWADGNRLIVLYPQAVTTPSNPQGCWDWFAYDDDAYYTREGRQVKAVAAMLDRLQARRPAVASR